MDPVTVVEVRDRTGVVTERIRLASTDVTAGRSLENSIVLADDYADAHHLRARLLPDEGKVLVQDLGTTNGSVVGGQLLRGSGAEVRFGDPVGVGEVTLTFLAQSAVVPDAKVLERPRETAVPYERIPAWSVMALAVIYATASLTWLSYEPTNAGSVLGAATLVGVLLTLWTGLWATGTRLFRGAWRFRQHLAVASVLTLVLMPASTLLGAGAYALGNATVRGLLGWGVLGFAFWGLALFAHIDVASERSRGFKAGLAYGLAGGATLAIWAAFRFEATPVERIQNSLVSIYPIPASVTRSSSLDDLLERGAALEDRHERIVELASEMDSIASR